VVRLLRDYYLLSMSSR